MNLIEKLKNNLCQWRCMPKAEQDFMKSLPPVKLIIGRKYKITPKEEEECTSLDKGIYTISRIEKNGIFAVEEKPEGFEGVRRGDSSLYDFELIPEPEIELALPTEEETVRAAAESDEAAIACGVQKFDFFRNVKSFSDIKCNDLYVCALCYRHEKLDNKTKCALRHDCRGHCTEQWRRMETCYYGKDLIGFRQGADFIHADLVRLLAEDRAKKKEPEIIRCEVKEINGNLFFIENSGPVRLYKALGRANYIRCEDEDGDRCSLRDRDPNGRLPARWPKWVLFGDKK